MRLDDKVMMRVFCKPDKAHDMTRLLEDITVKYACCNVL